MLLSSKLKSHFFNWFVFVLMSSSVISLSHVTVDFDNYTQRSKAIRSHPNDNKHSTFDLAAVVAFHLLT